MPSALEFYPLWAGNSGRRQYQKVSVTSEAFGWLFSKSQFGQCLKVIVRSNVVIGMGALLKVMQA